MKGKGGEYGKQKRVGKDTEEEEVKKKRVETEGKLGTEEEKKKKSGG